MPSADGWAGLAGHAADRPAGARRPARSLLLSGLRRRCSGASAAASSSRQGQWLCFPTYPWASTSPAARRPARCCKSEPPPLAPVPAQAARTQHAAGAVLLCCRTSAGCVLLPVGLLAIEPSHCCGPAHSSPASPGACWSPMLSSTRGANALCCTCLKVGRPLALLSRAAPEFFRNWHSLLSDASWRWPHLLTCAAFDCLLPALARACCRLQGRSPLRMTLAQSGAVWWTCLASAAWNRL